LKIAFDEHVPVQMLRVFKSLGLEKRFKGFEFAIAKDYAPKPTDPDYIRKSDVPWLERFAKDGGKIIISGNVRMMDNPLEMQALRELGFKVFFFEAKWNQWDFFQKSALLLFYWERIAAKIRRGKSGKFWRIPGHFKTDGGLRDATPGKKQIKKTSPNIAGGKVQAGGKGSRRKLDEREVQPDRPKGRKGRPSRPPDPRQTALELAGGSSHQPGKA
jgi:hypothetical protein